MSASVLLDIVAATRRRVASLPHPRADVVGRSDGGVRFRKALVATAPAIIAEIKRASPSRGVIRASINVADLARAYLRGGAAAISVLTEPEFFHGSVKDLSDAAAAVALPVLRKDFILSEAQLFESAKIGASAVLLITAVLSASELQSLRRIAEDDLGLAALVEVHDADEFQRALDSGATVIGINNRNLHTFDVSLQVSEQLARLAPRGVTLVAESGIRTAADIQRLQRAGISAFLIGEALMSADDPAATLRALTKGAAS